MLAINIILLHRSFLCLPSRMPSEMLSDKQSPSLRAPSRWLSVILGGYLFYSKQAIIGITDYFCIFAL